MKTKITAQQIINTCEKHGIIHWKQLQELVNKDRELGAKKGEFKTWPKINQK